VLEENERTYLWQIEHQGLVLGRHGFRPLADALGRGDQDTLRNLMAAGFTGFAPRDPREVRFDDAFAHVVRREPKGQSSPPESFDAANFSARLMEYRQLFDHTKPPTVKLALMALQPEKRDER